MNLLLIALKAGNSRITMLVDSESGEVLFLLHRWLSSLSSLSRTGEGALRSLFYKSTNLTPCDLSTSQMPHLKIASPWGLGFNRRIWEGRRHSAHSTEYFLD